MCPSWWLAIYSELVSDAIQLCGELFFHNIMNNIMNNINQMLKIIKLLGLSFNNLSFWLILFIIKLFPAKIYSKIKLLTWELEETAENVKRRIRSPSHNGKRKYQTL